MHDAKQNIGRRDLDHNALVRHATREDAAAIAALVNRAYMVEAFFISEQRTTIEEIRALLDEESDTGSFLVLDGTEGQLAGSVYLRIDGSRGYFGLLAVDPDLQSVGLGRRLVAVAEALSQAEGCTTMELQVVNLRSELAPWYRSLGYAERGTAPFPQGAPTKLPCHFVQMSKSLS